MYLPFTAPMPETPEAHSIIQAAEKAAEAGNLASAENLLRDAARQQEANLGPRHPDLANTLNNLGIVCEMTGKADEAEQYFRRAVSIARTSLHPDHPFVATSQKNLREFCEARGKQVELPPPAPAPVAEARKPVPDAPAPNPEQEVTPAIAIDPEPEQPEKPQLAASTLFHRVALGVLGPIAMLMVVLAVGLPRLGSSARVVPLPPVPAAVDAIPAREESPATTAAATDEEVDEASSDVVTPAPAPASAPARPVVVRASLCGDIDDWSCDPADNPVPSGPLFLYTQIKSPSATNVQHRWYHNGRLLQTVKLRVQANRKTGYRTYSRNVMTSESAGSWRVEVRGEDGTLLHEERFTVR